MLPAIAARIASDGRVSDGSINTKSYEVRPVFYLTPDSVFKGGDGSIDDPYELEISSSQST